MSEVFFTPKSVAVIGASRDSHKLGYGVIRNLIEYKFKGEIYPVNRHATEILGMPCYSSIEELPRDTDLAVIIVPAPSVTNAVKQCGSRGIKHAIVVSGGFRETGDEGAKLENELKKTASELGIRLIGPNCIGTIDTHTPINTTFVVGMPQQGEIGFVSQSGAMVAAVIDWATGAGVGFSRMVSLGNQVDVSEAEMARSIGDDSQTRVVTAYMEGVSDGQKFLENARYVAEKKPFIVLKGGKSEKGAEAVRSHTGALSGTREAYSAAFNKCGVQEASTMEEMFDWARAFAWQPLPKGNRVAVLTNAGGPAILAVDAIEKAGLELSPLSDQTKDYLKKRLPAAASVNNPVDVLAGSGPATYTIALEALLNDDTVDAVIVIQAPQDWFLPASLAEVVGEAAGLHQKPVIASIMGKYSVDEALAILHKRKVPNVSFPERAASILSAMGKRREWLELRTVQKKFQRPGKAEGADAFVKKQKWENLIGTYGIETAGLHQPDNPEEVIESANKMGYPVVMKISSQTHTHKTEIGGIRVNLKTDEEVKQAWLDLEKLIDLNEISDGVIVMQQMITGGQEVIVGFRRDSQFGPLLLFGTGGTDVELYKDTATALAPVCLEEAKNLIESTIAGKKLKGWRGMPVSDIPAVEKAIIAMGSIAAEHPEISELEINPLIVRENGKGAVAVDVRGTLVNPEIKQEYSEV